MGILGFFLAVLTGIFVFCIFLYLDHKKYGNSPFTNLNRSIFNIFYSTDKDDTNALKIQATKLRLDITEFEKHHNILGSTPDYISVIARRTLGIVIAIASIITILVGFILNIPLYGIGIAGLVIAILIAFYPEAKLKSEAERKKQEVEENLVYFLDLLGTALKTKMPIWDALVKTAKHYDSTLSNELLEINKKVMVSNKSWDSELENLALKYESPQISEFTSNVITASETGSDILRVVGETADYLKSVKVDKTQESAEKFASTSFMPLIAFKLLPIMVLMILPALSQLNNISGM